MAFGKKKPPKEPGLIIRDTPDQEVYLFASKHLRLDRPGERAKAAAKETVKSAGRKAVQKVSSSGPGRADKRNAQKLMETARKEKDPRKREQKIRAAEKWAEDHGIK